MTPYNQIPQQGMMPQGPEMGAEDPSQMVPPEAMPQEQMPPEEPEVDMELAITNALESFNLAEKLDEEELNKVGALVHKKYEEDLASMRDWLNKNNEWLRLALLMREEKTFPWPGASNVKYPLLATAAMQFSARAYPTLVPADNMIVKSRVIGFDPDGTRADKADRVSKHMSYQIMHQIKGWEEDMDRLLMIMSIVGVLFKKTYRDDSGKIQSELIYPENLIIDYYAKTVEDAYAKTELRTYTKNEYTSNIRSGKWHDIGPIFDVDGGNSVNQSPEFQKTATITQTAPASGLGTPHLFLAQHTYYDVDKDGYDEPVVIVVHHDTRKVVRIIPRFTLSGVKFNEKKEIVSIEAIEYFTDFQFLPNPDGSIYGLGFGVLLGPMNEAINSLCNQLVDAGTINNLQSGFLGKGLRIQMKETQFKPGEWKAVNASGEDLKNSIFPLPSKEPSSVLFQLMNLLIQAGNQLASVAEIFVGKMPGQNTPATTTQETVDQAMKVFTAIYKRTYRALLREFQKIYRLNRYSPDIVQEVSKILNIPVTVSDYDSEEDIIPAADPSGNSATTQFQQMQSIGQLLLPMGVINPQEYTNRMLKLIQIPDPQTLIMPPQPPPPDPKVETEKMKQETMQMKAQTDAQVAQQKLQVERELAELKKQQQEQDLMFKQQMHALELQGKQQEAKMDQLLAVMQQQHSVREMAMQSRHSEQDHQMKMQQNQQMHQQKQKMMAQKPKANSKGAK